MNKTIFRIYKLLYKKFGPRGWWPIILKKGALPIYRKNIYRLSSQTQIFQMAIGAILTQNISWDNVKKALVNLYDNDLLSPQQLLKEKEERLHNLIKMTGYYRQKTKRLKEFSFHWLKNYKKWRLMDAASLRQELLSIKGIGRETADSIMLYGFCRFSFVIDSYTKRIYSRAFDKEINDYEMLKDEFEKNLPEDIAIYNEYHALIVDLAKNNCFKKNPLCASCPINSLCQYFKRRKYESDRGKVIVFDRRRRA
jgi:endonuclease-3 related protein